MTFIAQQPDDTRAKRRFDLIFRQDGGPFPDGKPGPLHINTKDQGDSSNTEESGLQ